MQTYAGQESWECSQKIGADRSSSCFSSYRVNSKVVTYILTAVYAKEYLGDSMNEVSKQISAFCQLHT